MIGQTISHYKILEQIGAGGMGVVYRAHDDRLDRDVALKVLAPDLAGDQEFIARFRREARTLSKLSHPNVATVHDFDTQDGISFIVMEYIEGSSLVDKIRRGALPANETIRLGMQLLDGLAAAHARGIIHRDLKPGNLRETLDGRLKILDFGLARTLTSDLDVTQSVATSSGIVGTLPYMAPEQLRGEYADARTDIYSAGVVLYEFATGSRPFPDNFAPRLTDSILHRIPISTRELNPQVPVELDTLIRTALEKEPQRRFGSAREMLDALDRIRTSAFVAALGQVEGSPQPTSPDSPPPLVQSNPAVETPATSPRQEKLIPAASKKNRIAAATAILLTVCAALAVWVFRGHLPVKNLRPTIAVIGFKNQTGSPDVDWISTSLSDMLASELAAGDQIVPTPAESVARMKIDLALPNEASYAADTVQRVRRSLRCDYLVFGWFSDSGKSAGGHVTIDLELRNAKTGAAVARLRDSGTDVALPELAARAGAELRAKLGLPGISSVQSTELQAAVPASAEASRLYFAGLGQLRTFDLLGAKDSLTKATKADPNFSLAHAYLATAWSGLGYDDNAKTEAKTAFDLSPHLSREDKTLVEARFREISSEWDKATDLYRSLWTLYPENFEYAIRTADAQIRAGKSSDALKTIALLRDQPDSGSPDSIANDPRLDLKEAEAAEAVSDFAKEKLAAQRAASGANVRGSRLLESEALWRACAAMASLGEAQGAQSACSQSIAISKPVGDVLLTARAYTILGLIAGTQGDLKQSIEQHRQALTYARKIGSRRDIAGALTNIGNVLASQGDLAGAQGSYENALAEAQEINDRGQIVNILNNLATINQTLGKFSVALRLYEESAVDAQALQDKGSSARAQSNMAFIYSLQGDFPAALRNLQQAVRLAQETGNKSDQAQFLNALGDIQLDQNDLATAEETYRSALSLASAIGDKSSIALGRVSLARLKLRQGKAAEAEVLARQSADEYQAEDSKDMESGARTVLASALLELDRPTDAAAELDRVSKLASQDPTIKLELAIVAARLQFRSGNIAAGKSQLDHAASDAGKLGLSSLQFEARLALGEAGLFGGDKRAALAQLAALQKDAAKKGFRLIEVRARDVSRQITDKTTG